MEPPPLPPKDDIATRRNYLSLSAKMLQEIGDGTGISQLTTLAALVQDIIVFHEFQVNNVKIIEDIYTLLCAIIHMCKNTNVYFSISSLSSLDNLIETLTVIRATLKRDSKRKKLIRNGSSKTSIEKEKYAHSLDQAKKDFSVKYDITSSQFPRTHSQVVEWHRSITGVLLRRHLKRYDDSVWSLPDTLRPSKDREPELQQIITSLLEATHGTCIAILGPKDTGKTSLALSVMHHSEIADHFGSRRHFLQCTKSHSTVGELMMITARSFGLESVEEDHPEAIFNYLRAIKPKEPVLVVLDGYESIWEVIQKKTYVADFVPLLCSIPQVSVLLTITDTKNTGPTVVRWTYPLMSPLQVQRDEEHRLGSDESLTIRSNTITETSNTMEGASTPRLSLKQLFLRIPRSHKLYRGLGISTETISYSLPRFPCSLYSLNMYRLNSPSVLKHTPLSISSLSKTWKTRYLVLSAPIFERHRTSAKPGVAYLHLFKSSAPEAEEVDRLRIDDERMTISSESNTSGDHHVIRVCGIDARVPKQSENNSPELTTWRLQINGSSEAQKWVSLIRDSVREQWCLSPLQNETTESLGDRRTTGRSDTLISSGSIAPSNTVSRVQINEHVDDEFTLVHRRFALVLKDPIKYKEFLRSTGNKAQLLLDFMQDMVDHPKLSDKLRRQLIHAIVRLSKKSNLYPSCFLLKDVQLVDDCPLAGGHTCDIWKGILRKRTVCLKVVKIYTESNVTDLLKSFAVEALIWGQYSHIDLLPFYGMYRLSDSHNRVCLASPWMENGNINEFLRQNPGSNRLLLALDVLQGLAYLHRNRVVHGDLKGPNILVASNGRACIADFGLSAMVDSDALRWTSLTTTISDVGGGTVRWQAPELFGNDSLDGDRSPPGRRSRASDIYAYACVCYEIFTGNYPFFEIQLDVTVMINVMRGSRPIRPHKSSPPFTQFGLTESIWRVMANCWDHTPSKRPTAAQIHEHLTAGKTISDPRPTNGWENLSSLRFRQSMHKYPNLSDLDTLLPSP